jgi:hypothetical protein
MKRITRAGLLSRLERLESRSACVESRLKIRFGHLRRLSQKYKGERHVIVTRQLPNRGDQEWVEFEEVPGPDPSPPQCPARGLPIHLDVMLVEAYSWREEAAAV